MMPNKFHACPTSLQPKQSRSHVGSSNSLPTPFIRRSSSSILLHRHIRCGLLCHCECCQHCPTITPQILLEGKHPYFSTEKCHRYMLYYKENKDMYTVCPEREHW